ncbi:MAG: hypothetical protein EBS55_08190 [Flavobacteriaceae bacterium]|nr:hypothetical protein [Flavobacteriaceae bacterium]
MPVIFPYGSQIDIGSARFYLSYYANDLRSLMAFTGNGTPDAMSDWWGANFYGDLYIDQQDGYIWDGCQGRDHWCWAETTGEYGDYCNAWGGYPMYNTERGYNNGTFLTFGYGYCTVRVRPGASTMIASASSNDYNCRAFYVDVYWYNGGYVVAGNYFGYAGGYQEVRYYYTHGFQEGRSFRCRLILWY